MMSKRPLHSLEDLVKVEVEVLRLAAVEVESAAAAAAASVQVVLLPLLRVGQNLVRCKGKVLETVLELGINLRIKA